MSKFNTIGGLRLKHFGRACKETLLKKFEIALNSVVEDFDLESFSGANLYLQIYNKSGERLALISSDGKILSGFDTTNIDNDFSLRKIGCGFTTVADIKRETEKAEKEWQDEQEKIRALHTKRFDAKVEKGKMS